LETFQGITTLIFLDRTEIIPTIASSAAGLQRTFSNETPKMLTDSLARNSKLTGCMGKNVLRVALNILQDELPNALPLFS